MALVAVLDITEIDADLIVAQHGPFVLMVAGVIATGSPTYDEWIGATTWVQKVEKASPFWIGDLLSYGECTWGEKYTQAIEATGHKVGYLMNVASVAQKIPAERRHPELSFSHHQEVAALSEPEQTEWLDKAEEEDWSSKDLRQHLRVSKAKAAGQTVELGLWVGCADLADQEALYAQFVAEGRAVKKTTKELA
jgi:hypothetical protein